MRSSAGNKGKRSKEASRKAGFFLAPQLRMILIPQRSLRSHNSSLRSQKKQGGEALSGLLLCALSYDTSRNFLKF